MRSILNMNLNTKTDSIKKKEAKNNIFRESSDYLSICLVFNVKPGTLEIILLLVIGRAEGNQYKQLVKVLYCKLLTNSKQPSVWDSNSGLEAGRGVCYHCTTGLLSSTKCINSRL